MGKKTGLFIEGQHVFAKVKGYSAWPAKITKVIQKYRYGVYFYGTGETASVRSEDIDPYDEKNRARFNTDRQLKKDDYREAVNQIEAALNGNDPAPILDDKQKFANIDDSVADSTADYTSADESQLKIAEDVAKSTPLPLPKKKPVVNKIKLEVSSPFTPEPETKENDEKVSRSGRKIIPKKINNDEMDPDEMFQQPKKRIKLDDSHKKAPTSLVETNDAIDEFRASKLHILQNPVKRNLLEQQFDLIHIMQDIKQALGLAEADVDHSIELLERFNADILPHVTTLMLLKYPNIVDIVKRLRKYIGNTHSWAMEEAQIETFQNKAQQIRTLALMVYEKFKALFNYPEESSFWSKFAEEQKAFQEKYNALSDADLFEGLTTEELDSFINNKTLNEETLDTSPAAVESFPEPVTA